MVDFWCDIWCGDRPLAQVIGVSNPSHSLVAEFFTPHGWNVPQLKECIPDFLVQQITSIHFSLDRDDVMVWTPSTNGNFSVASAWGDIRQKRNISWIDRWVWGSIVPLRVSFFVWRLLRNWISLDSLLQDKGVALCSRCSCCQQGPETINHLFLHGTVAGEVWEHFFKVFGLLPFTAVSVAAMLSH